MQLNLYYTNGSNFCSKAFYGQIERHIAYNALEFIEANRIEFFSIRREAEVILTEVNLAAMLRKSREFLKYETNRAEHKLFKLDLINKEININYLNG